MKNKLKIGTDFSGVGSFNQALKRLKIQYEELFACDMDKYARQTFLLNFGNEMDQSFSAPGINKTKLAINSLSFYFPTDVYKRNIPDESLDIYVTSPPCQSFSLAGKRLGKEDERGILFFNSLDFIRKNNPRFFIFENVKGLLSHDKVDKKQEFGKTFQEWINYLGGKSVNGVHTFFPYEDSVPYHIYFQVLNAKDYGIPQNRERVFIIGIRDDSDNDFQFPKPFPLTKRLKDILETEVDEKYFLSDKMLNGLFDRKKNNIEKGNGFSEKIDGDISGTIVSRYSKDGKEQLISTNVMCLGNVNPSGNGMNGNVFDQEGISPTLTTNKGEGIKIGTWRTHEDGKGFREMEDELCPTISARAREDGSGQPVIKILGYTRDKKGNVVSRHEKDISGTIHTGSGGGGNMDQFLIINSNTQKGYDEAEEEEDSINFSVPNSKTRRGRVGKKVSQTLDTQCNQGIYTNQRIRRLTPKECMRLMGFNDDFIERTIDSKLISDSQLYKQCGNSIVVDVFVEILKKILKTQK